MKTWVVRLPNDDRQAWMGNAETPEEAVKYAIAKGNLPIVTRYVVYDWNLDRFEVEQTSPPEAA